MLRSAIDGERLNLPSHREYEGPKTFASHKRSWRKASQLQGCCNGFKTCLSYLIPVGSNISGSTRCAYLRTKVRKAETWIERKKRREWVTCIPVVLSTSLLRTAGALTRTSSHQSKRLYCQLYGSLNVESGKRIQKHSRAYELLQSSN